MASQHFGRVSHHDEEAEILRGGMLLSYGLTKESGQIFARLIQSTSPKVRDRAWFFLAKIRYQRGYLPEAENALAQVENNLPEGLQEERILLQANLLMAHGDYTAAADVLNGMSLKASSSRYARYNLGIALLKLDGTPRSIARGMAILDDVGRMPAENEEFRGPARPRQRRARLHRARRRRSEDGAGLPRAGAPEEPAGEQGAARLRLGRRFAQGSQARARALARARRPRRRRLGGARGTHRRALRLRQARRLRPGARASYNDAIAAFDQESKALRRIDRRAALAEVDRRS